MDDVFVRLTKMPYKVSGLTSLDDNGDYNVYINTEVCPEKQEAALKHEFRHIHDNHFYDDAKSLDSAESEADDDSENVEDFPEWKMAHWG